MFHDKSLTLKAAKENAGAVSDRNSKMPGSSFAISAKHCKVGGKLAGVQGSVCDRCYALKLQNLRPSVDKGWTSNYLKATRMIAANPENWAKAVAFQINRSAKKSGEPFHRWFDSGDLQSVEMLAAICRAAELTPAIKHWLPTREAKIVKDYVKAGGVVPVNLVIRISSTMIGDAPIRGHENTSTVHRKGETVHGKECNAYRTDAQRGLVSEAEFKRVRKLPAAQRKADGWDFGHCGDCRACWSKDVANVSYPLH